MISKLMFGLGVLLAIIAISNMRSNTQEMYHLEHNSYNQSVTAYMAGCMTLAHPGCEEAYQHDPNLTMVCVEDLKARCLPQQKKYSDGLKKIMGL